MRKRRYQSGRALTGEQVRGRLSRAQARSLAGRHDSRGHDSSNPGNRSDGQSVLRRTRRGHGVPRFGGPVAPRQRKSTPGLHIGVARAARLSSVITARSRSADAPTAACIRALGRGSLKHNVHSPCTTMEDQPGGPEAATDRSNRGCRAWGHPDAHFCQPAALAVKRGKQGYDG